MFCLTLFNFIKAFLSVSNIHGFNHLSEGKQHIIERLVWLLLICAAITGTIILSRLTLERYYENPTVISMERDRFSWNTSFPAATICPTHKLDETLLEEFINFSQEPNKTLLKEFIVSLANANYKNFDEIVKYDGITNEQYLPLILDLQFKFQPEITISDIQIQDFGFEQIISEMGICYTINSQLAKYNSPNYWENDEWRLLKNFEILKFSPLDGEIFVNVRNMETGFHIYLHGPYEVADIASKAIYSDDGYFLQLFLTGLSLYSSDRTKDLKVSQRKCRLYDESNLRHSPVYSFVLCRMECRAMLAKKLCGCIPYFYRKRAGDRICNVEGLHCLGRHKEKLVMLKKECPCLPNCDEVNYVVERLETREWFLGSSLQWGLKDYPRMRLKRDVIFGFTDLLVYIGGMAGLFLGCSILSFIEIIYFMTIRLFWFLIRKDRK